MFILSCPIIFDCKIIVLTVHTSCYLGLGLTVLKKAKSHQFSKMCHNKQTLLTITSNILGFRFLQFGPQTQRVIPNVKISCFQLRKYVQHLVKKDLAEFCCLRAHEK